MTLASELIIKGGWMPTSTGRLFPVVNPEPDDIDILDIAQGLGAQRRYSGQPGKHYSVAEHSLYISYAVAPENALFGLLHDATEAYIADLPRPLKRELPEYKVFELAIMEVIAAKFGLTMPEPPEVKDYDTRILLNEFERLFPEPARSAGLNHFRKLGYEPIPDLIIRCYPAEVATRLFLQRFKHLTGLD